jgi:hypothetical protein
LGHVVFSQPSLLTAGPANLLFQGRHLLCLSSTLSVFDTITCQALDSPMPLDPLLTPPQSQAPLFLVRNKFDGTIAVGLGKSEWPWQTSVLIFGLGDPRNNAAEEGADGLRLLHEASYPGLLKGLLPSTTGPGYFLIDNRNQIKILRDADTVAATKRLVARTASEGGLARGLASVFGRAIMDAADNTPLAIEGAEIGQQLVTSLPADSEPSGSVEARLEAAVRCTTSALAPSPAELFQRVVGVLATAQA